MAERVLEILNKRTQFLSLLEQDISKNDHIFEEVSKSLEQVEKTCENVKKLGERPEHEALIPLCKNLYIPGRIIHTGEYLVTAKAQPNSYSILKTLDQTINSLEQQIQQQKKKLEKAEVAKIQLQERKKILYGDDSVNLENLNVQKNEEDEDVGIGVDSDDDDDANYEQRQSEVDNMPKEVYSDKGVALKVGKFFEILEYEDS